MRQKIKGCNYKWGQPGNDLWREQHVSQVLGGSVKIQFSCFWSKGLIDLKVPKWEYAWYVQGTARTPVAEAE